MSSKATAQVEVRSSGTLLLVKLLLCCKQSLTSLHDEFCVPKQMTKIRPWHDMLWSHASVDTWNRALGQLFRKLFHHSHSVHGVVLTRQEGWLLQTKPSWLGSETWNGSHALRKKTLFCPLVKMQLADMVENAFTTKILTEVA